MVAPMTNKFQTSTHSSSFSVLQTEHSPTYYKQESLALSMADLESSQQRSTGRSEEHWKNFYKNGLPIEVIVIEDSPSPQIRNSVEPEPIQQRPMASNDSGASFGAAHYHLGGWSVEICEPEMACLHPNTDCGRRPFVHRLSHPVSRYSRE